MTTTSKRVEGPKKKGVVGIDTEGLGFRIKSEVRKELDQVKDYEHYSTVSELVRGWTLEKLSEYRNNPRFQAWLKERQAKAAKLDQGQVQLA